MVSWKMLNIGQVSRNRYWGEAEEKPLRPGICSSTVLWDSGHVILVDPPREGEEMIRLLDSHTGLKAEQVDTVFVTHGHTDHFEGLGMFPHARWCCGIKEQDRLRALINDVGLDGMRLQGVEKRISPQIEVVGLPGHTVGLSLIHILRIRSRMAECRSINLLRIGAYLELWRKRSG